MTFNKEVMAMSDCEKCWSTPCECGWTYKNWSAETLSKHITSITQYRSKKEAKTIIKKALEMIDPMEQWQSDFYMIKKS